MRINFPFGFSANQRNFMRRAGYAAFNDPNTGVISYTRRLSRDYYPRFHAYLSQDRDLKQFINLHLDQKKPSYAGSSAHNAEYDGEVLTQESNRLEGLIKNQMDNQSQKTDISDQRSEVKKSFWSKFFS